jgi:hypothetical protein
MGQKFWVTTGEDKVINIKNKDYEMASYFLAIDIRVIMTSRKSIIKKKGPFWHKKLKELA